MKGAWAVSLVLAASLAFAVRVEWLTRPGTYVEGQTVRVEARIIAEEGERIGEVRGVALPSGREVFSSMPGRRGGTLLRYWDTTGYGGTTALRLEVSYMGRAGTGTAYAVLPVSIRGMGLGAQQVQAQGFLEDLDGFVSQACRVINFYDLASVRWLCTAQRTIKKAQRYWEQLGGIWEDFKNQVIYYGTGLVLDWIGKGLGLHQLNPVVDQVDQAIDGFMSDIRRQKNAIVNALARARAQQVNEIMRWQPGQSFPQWGPEWWARFVARVVPQLGFQITEQALRDIQRTAQLLEGHAAVAQEVQNQQEELKPEEALRDLWDTLGAAWNFVKEAVQNGWASLTGALSGSSAEGPGGAALPLGSASVPKEALSMGSVPGGQAAPTAGSVAAQSGQVQGQNSGQDASFLPDGIADTLVNEARTAVSTREVTEVLVRGFAEMLKLEAMASMRTVQELKNLATKQVMTVQELSRVNQHLVELIKAQEKNLMDELRRGMAYVTARGDEVASRYMVMGEVLEQLSRTWRAQNGTPGQGGGTGP